MAHTLDSKQLPQIHMLLMNREDGTQRPSPSIKDLTQLYKQQITPKPTIEKKYSMSAYFITRFYWRHTLKKNKIGREYLILNQKYCSYSTCHSSPINPYLSTRKQKRTDLLQISSGLSVGLDSADGPGCHNIFQGHFICCLKILLKMISQSLIMHSISYNQFF